MTKGDAIWLLQGIGPAVSQDLNLSSCATNSVPGLMAASDGSSTERTRTDTLEADLFCVKQDLRHLTQDFQNLLAAHERLLGDHERLRDLKITPIDPIQVGRWETSDLWSCNCPICHKAGVYVCAMCGRYRPARPR